MEILKFGSPRDKGTTKAETKLYGYWPYIN